MIITLDDVTSNDLDNGTFTVPDNITAIGHSAFLYCTEVKKIKIPQSVKLIDDRAFEGCYRLKHITIPEGVIELGYDVFAGCEKLKTIRMPKSLKRIGIGIFNDCYDLTDIYYSGDREEWNKLSFFRMGLRSNVTIHFNSTGIIA